MPADRPAADVSVRDLTKSYGGVGALRGIGFDVAAGQIYGLLGPNGAGKTTALECLLGLRQPDGGRVTIGGIDALLELHRCRAFVGAQLQAATLQDKITVREALALAASFYVDPAPVDELLSRFGLEAKATARFETLSGGQKQRVLLALAWVNRPRVVVLDEPTAGLDPVSRRELQQLLLGLRADGCTVLLSTHQLDEAEQLCDRIGILHEGRIVADAAPAALIAGARARPRLLFRTERVLDETAVRSLPGATLIEPKEGGWCVHTSEVGRAVTVLAQQVERESNTLIAIQIRRPTLEDVFVEMTGRAWMAEPAAQADSPAGGAAA